MEPSSDAGVIVIEGGSSDSSGSARNNFWNPKSNISAKSSHSLNLILNLS